MSVQKQVHSIGRRKTATCRVYLKKGEGNVLINRKPISSYFDTIDQRDAAVAALRVLSVEKDFDVLCFPKGGGKCGQAGAVRLAIARALKKYEASLHEVDEKTDATSLLPWHKTLRDSELLTCDSRQVERKKFGLVSARKPIQYSKR